MKTGRVELRISDKDKATLQKAAAKAKKTLSVLLIEAGLKVAKP